VGFTATDRLDKVFEVGILLKGLDGLLEIAGGVLLLLIKPQYLNQLASTLTQHELSEDPHDFLSSYILHSTQNLAAGSLVFAALYLLSHGIVKIVLVWEILHNRFWAYLGLIYLTIGFMVYQISPIQLLPLDRPCSPNGFRRCDRLSDSRRVSQAKASNRCAVTGSQGVEGGLVGEPSDDLLSVGVEHWHCPAGVIQDL